MPHPRKRLPPRARIGERKLRTLSREGPRTGTKLRKKTPLELVGTELGQDSPQGTQLSIANTSSWMAVYAALEKWAMRQFPRVQYRGKWYPQIWGPRAKKVYDYFREALDHLVAQHVKADGITDPIGTPPPGYSEINAKMTGLEMKWRPYWSATSPAQSGPFVDFWDTLRDVAKYIDAWIPQGHAPKAIVVWEYPKDAQTAKKKKKPGHGVIILILLAAWLVSRKTKQRRSR